MRGAAQRSLVADHEEAVPQLRSELLQACLPSRQLGVARMVIWTNTVCAAILAVGVLGIRQSTASFTPKTQAPEPVFTPVEVFQPPPQPPSEPIPSTETPADEVAAPALPTVAVVAIDDPAKVAFAVPLQNVTSVTNRVELVAIPPRRDAPQPVVKPRSGPVRWEGAVSKESVGGVFPQPDYPRDALLHHVAGTVEVLVAVTEEGLIETAEIQSSSGSAILDRHAVQFLKRKWKWPAGGRREFIVPVEFSLQQ